MPTPSRDLARRLDGHGERPGLAASRVRDRHRRGGAVRDARAAVALRLRGRDGAAGIRRLAGADRLPRSGRLRRLARLPRRDPAGPPGCPAAAGSCVAPRSPPLPASTLNLCMFIAFDRITVALALLGFYTYPALVAVANVALGRERLDGTRVAGPRARDRRHGRGRRVAARSGGGDPARRDRHRRWRSARPSARRSSWSSARDGYPEVPTEQAMTAVLLASTVIGAVAVALVAGGVQSLVPAAREPERPAAPGLHRDLRRGDPVDSVS